jgi:hypothetical protein
MKGRYSPLKNYQTKAQNVIEKYGNKKTASVTVKNPARHSYNLSTLPSANRDLPEMVM